MIRIFSIITVLFFGTSVRAQGIDLVDALHLALQNKPAFTEADAQLRAAEQALPLAESANKFTLGANLNGNKLYYPESEFEQDNTTLTLRLKKSVYNAPQLRDVSIANEQMAKAMVTREIFQSEQLLLVSGQFINIAKTQIAVDEAAKQIETFGEELKRAQRMLELGSGNKLDVLALKSALSQAQAERFDAQSKRQVAIRQLASSTGKTTAQLQINQENLLSFDHHVNERVIADQSHPLLKQAGLDLQIANSTLDKAYSQKQPQADFSIQASSSYDGNEEEALESYSATVDVSWQLGSGGRLDAAINEAQAQVDAAAATLETVDHFV